VILEDDIGHPWDRDSPGFKGGGSWSRSEQLGFSASPEAARIRSRFSGPELAWTREVTAIRTEPGRPVIVIRDTFSGEKAGAPKVLTLNMAAEGEVATPAGKIAPPPRTHPRTSHDPDNTEHERPSATPPFDLSPGVNRLGFTGAHGVDWDVYVLGGTDREALLGNWAVTLWGGHAKQRLERQHILRLRAGGPFTTVITPWRRGEKPAGLQVEEEAAAVVVTTDSDSTRIDGDGVKWTPRGGETLEWKL
jgi:hypothetical protein